MKHHKRRIVQPQLAQSIHGALADGGAWRIATDIEDYALHVHEVMDGRTDFRNAGTIAVSLPTGHVGKGNAELADDMPHAISPNRSDSTTGCSPISKRRDSPRAGSSTTSPISRCDADYGVSRICISPQLT